MVAVAVIGVVDLVGARAQVPAGNAEAVSAGSDGLPLEAVVGNARMSDDGRIVVFDTVPGDPPAPQVVVRDRVAGVTTPVPDANSSAPGISGDGCIVAYSVVVPGDPLADPVVPHTVQLRAFNRCAVPPTSVEVDVVEDSTTPLPPPALSADGSVIVWSDGADVRRYARTGPGAYADPVLIDAGPDGPSVGPVVDVSANGSVVAFTAGTGDPFLPDGDSNVYVWIDGAADVELVSSTAGTETVPAAPSTGRSIAPTVSADGRIVLFQSNSLDVAANTLDVAGPFVVMLDRGVNGVGRGTLLLAQGATRPNLSADGHHAVFDRAGAVVVSSWGSGAPFSDAVEAVVSVAADGNLSAVGASTTGAVVSRHGEVVVFDSPAGAALTGDAAFHGGPHVWARSRPPVLTAPALDLGSTTPGGSLTATIAFLNTGGPSVVVSNVTADGPFQVDSAACPPVVHPGTSCLVEVSVTLAAEGAVAGTVRVTASGAEFSAAVSATAATTTTQAPTTTDPLPTTTIAPTDNTAPVATTVPQSTLPVGTAPATLPPRVTSPPRTTRPPRSTIPPRTTPPRTTPTATTTTTTVPLPLVFEPASFAFAPTIVVDGARTAAVDLVNPSSRSMDVVDVRIEPEGAFLLADANCAGATLAPGDRCSVQLRFSPSVEGEVTAALSADLGDGSVASATLTGTGAPPPTLSVVPGVANDGQVVAVLGAGFPAGATVEFSWDGDPTPRPVVVDDVGTFSATLVVLPHTPHGPHTVVVAGQPDLFGDVEAEVLIRSGARRTNAATLGGLGGLLNR